MAIRIPPEKHKTLDFSQEKRIATPVCALARNDSIHKKKRCRMAALFHSTYTRGTRLETEQSSS